MYPIFYLLQLVFASEGTPAGHAALSFQGLRFYIMPRDVAGSCFFGSEFIRRSWFRNVRTGGRGSDGVVRCSHKYAYTPMFRFWFSYLVRMQACKHVGGISIFLVLLFFAHRCQVETLRQFFLEMDDEDSRK